MTAMVDPATGLPADNITGDLSPAVGGYGGASLEIRTSAHP